MIISIMLVMSRYSWVDVALFVSNDKLSKNAAC